MPKGVMVVQCGPVSAERDAEFNDWLDNIHIAEVLAVPGFVGARRYRLVDAGGDDQTPEYLTVYDIEADDVVDARRELSARAGERTSSDAIRTDPPPRVFVYEQLPVTFEA